jgi:predicted acylesterase/phospholipase RssA
MKMKVRRGKENRDAQNGKVPADVVTASPEGKSRWWDDGSYSLFNGVFEGGGAKGLLYVGALEALRREKIWFRAVAGTSVGSIIAGLVASGLTVEQFGTQLMSMLSTFSPLSGFKSYRLLRRDAGILDPKELHEKLELVFAEQVVVQGGKERADPGAPVTFHELYQATNVELNVLAIDIFERREVVFNHKATPKCQVADAVLASSAIPGFFPPGRLVMDRNERVKLANPIVDGGVWANFPLFVFRDERFRAFHGLPELRSPEQKQVVGFLLEESQLISTGQRKARYAHPLRNARFAMKDELVLPAEVTLLADDATIMEIVEKTSKPDAKVAELSWRIRQAVGTRNPLVKLFSLNSSSLEKSPELPWLSAMPAPRSKVIRSLRFTSQLLRGALAPWIVLFAVLLLVLGSLEAMHDVRGHLSILSGLFPWLLVIIPATVVAFLGFASLLVGNFYFARVAERYGYLVASTLASAGAVRYWMDGDSVADPETGLPMTTIIRIPVPEDLRTLSFRYMNVDFALALARASVAEQLEALRDLPTRSREAKTRDDRAADTANVY